VNYKEQKLKLIYINIEKSVAFVCYCGTVIFRLMYRL